MNRSRRTYIKNILLPCVVFSMVTGILTGCLIFSFRWAATFVMERSEELYAFVRSDPRWLPLLLLGAALLGLGAAWILHWEPNCRGGGIPTAIAQLRGLLTFRWLRNVLLVFFSSLLTFFCGIPLGNEGPSVQMGTAVGRGSVRMFGRNNPAWDRYVMTGGACSGFAVATGAPLTGILFAFEEAHRRFSPMIFMVSASTVIFGTATSEFLCQWTGTGRNPFSLTLEAVLPLESLWTVVTVGLACGILAVGFTKIYRTVWGFLRKVGKRVPYRIMTVAIFVAVALLGFFFPNVLGSGHGMIHSLWEGQGIWYALLFYLIVRAVLLIVANNIGVTGGLFVPSLAFGAMIGFLCARGLTALGLLGEEYAVVLTAVGMAAFLGASSRIPLTAVAFSIEALCGLRNILAVTVGVTLAYLVIEVVGIEGFNETVIEGRVAAEREGKTSQTVETDVVVQPGAFVVGKEVRNILWPPSCVVLSVRRGTDGNSAHGSGMDAGDVLRVHYVTCDPEETRRSLEHLVGVQKTNP